MKAIVVSAPRTFSLHEIDKPIPREGWALIRVLTAAFCATDLEVLSGDIPAKYPITPGHECRRRGGGWRQEWQKYQACYRRSK
jgi:D-arabinose 1-dehydrogenase-like Zn-dependent alcohol dehydrogenase